jgi:hypothetical protein
LEKEGVLEGLLAGLKDFLMRVVAERKGTTEEELRQETEDVPLGALVDVVSDGLAEARLRRLRQSAPRPRAELVTLWGHFDHDPNRLQEQSGCLVPEVVE